MHGIYSLQNAFTYTSSLIPSSFPSTYLSRNNLKHTRHHAWHQDTQKNEQDIQVSIYRAHSLMKDQKANRGVQLGIPRIL